jgi:hypothetical protein
MEDNDGENGEGIKEGASIEEGKVKEARLEEGSVEVPEAKAMKTGATVEGPETTGKVFKEGAEVTVIEDALPEDLHARVLYHMLQSTYYRQRTQHLEQHQACTASRQAGIGDQAEIC